ncbi:anthranilate synthase component I family protein [Halegenticoccus tardaugens]|uniref:anthranilate synthase component I family protein n=1 Tax=Halegenticoccus tardaugens TaxID=2071624 RepID=UPI00100BFFF3|nr:anthranilate synthase component I family protein [Halegenticoccus tardaugens]
MNEPTVVTDLAAFRAAARDAPRPSRIPVEVRVSVDDPFDAYRRARGRSETEARRGAKRLDGAFLETTGGQRGWGYFAVDPIERLRVGPDAVVRSAAAGPDAPPADRSPTLSALDGLLSGETLVRGDCDVPYPCGAVGWLAYDVAREIEGLPDETAVDPGLPRLQLGVYDRVAAWREPRGEGSTTLRITACPRVGDESGGGTRRGARADAVGGGSDADAAYDRGLARALSLARSIDEGDPAVGSPAAASTARFESDCGREAFADRVRRVKEYVRAGDTFQTNVSQRLVAPAAVHPVDAYAALRRVNPAPYSALIESPGVDLVSASPELLLRREGNRAVTEPIAGTRRRGETPDADADLEADLLADEKERAEHAMLVDLERNDLGKVCEYGTVEVSEYRRVDRYSEVMHLVSVVEGRLRPDARLVDAIAATFPGGTVTGAPKPRTMEIIEEVESTRRGPYTGSVGIFGFDDRATLNIVIRTLVRRGDEYRLRVGAGIVHDSVPDREYEETLAKGRALVNAVDEALGERADLTVAGAGGETRERSESEATAEESEAGP